MAALGESVKQAGVVAGAGLAAFGLLQQRWAAQESKERAAERGRKLSSEDVVIVGCGLSGICVAIKLQDAGIPFTILEKEAGVGGTWFLNRYPGCACDVPAHLYSFSFSPKLDWSVPYAPQPEIRDYIDSVVDKYGLRKHIRLSCAMQQATWDEDTERWEVRTAQGDVLRPRFLINAIGGLHHAKYPAVPGLDSFEGPSFHSTHWRPDVELDGKRVAVVGSAASAVQLLPHVQKRAAKVVLLQRTPNWVASRRAPVLPRQSYSERQRWLFQRFPSTARLHRYAIYGMMESLFWPLGVFDKGGMGQNVAQRILQREMESRLQHRADLIEKVVPKFGVGCKRICRTDDYLETLLEDNVELVPRGLAAVTPRGVVDADGSEHEVDVIIYATGFEVGSIGKDCVVEGRRGCRITGTSAADEGMEAYLGCVSQDFPNLIQLLGPNTGLGHNSIVLMVEAMADYATRLLCEAVDKDVASFEVKGSVVEAHNEWLAREFEHRVWQHGGCQSWYKNDEGKIFSLWPSSTVKYMNMTANAPGLARAFDCTPLEPAAGAERARL